MGILFTTDEAAQNNSVFPTPVVYPFAISAWFKPSAISGIALSLFDDANESTDYERISFGNTDELLYEFNDGAASGSLVIDNVSVDGWQHVVIVANSTSFRSFFVNGAFVSYSTTSVAPSTLNRLKLGHATSDYLGKVADVGLWQFSGGATVAPGEVAISTTQITRAVADWMAPAGLVVGDYVLFTDTEDPDNTGIRGPITAISSMAITFPTGTFVANASDTTLTLRKAFFSYEDIFALRDGYTPLDTQPESLHSYYPLLDDEPWDNEVQPEANDTDLTGTGTSDSETPTLNVTNESLSNSITFTNALGPKEFTTAISNLVWYANTLERYTVFESFSNNVSFTDLLTKTLEKILANNITFANLATNNAIFKELFNSFGLTVTAAGIREFLRLLSQSLWFETQISPTYEETIAEILSFLNDLARVENPAQSVGFEDDVSFEISKALEGSVGFEDEVAFNFEGTRTLDTPVAFEDSIIAATEPDSCDLRTYDPYGPGLPAEPIVVPATGISFSCAYPAITLDLKNPQWGNKVTVSPARVLNVSRGGTANVYRNAMWAKRLTFDISILFVACDLVKREEILFFLAVTAGREVTYTDYDSREWTGVILTPDAEVVQPSRGMFQVDFAFKGVEV